MATNATPANPGNASIGSTATPASDGSSTGSAATAAPRRPTTSGGDSGWLLVRAIVAIVFGVIALVAPLPTIASLVLVFSAYLLADGVIALVAAVRAARRDEPWGGAALEGVANLIAGVIAFLWPGITLLVLVWVSGFWAIFSGVFLAWAGTKSRHGRGLRITAGVLSIVWGVLLLIAPVPGAIVMTLWLGAYAIVFGIALLVAWWRTRPGSGAHRSA